MNRTCADNLHGASLVAALGALGCNARCASDAAMVLVSTKI